MGADAVPINNFMHWFQAVLANMNLKAQRRAPSASRKAASSVFADAGDDKMSLIAVKTVPALGDVRKVEYSAIGFAPQNKEPLKEWQLELNKLQSARMRSDLKVPPPKCS